MKVSVSAEDGTRGRQTQHLQTQPRPLPRQAGCVATFLIRALLLCVQLPETTKALFECGSCCVCITTVPTTTRRLSAAPHSGFRVTGCVHVVLLERKVIPHQLTPSIFLFIGDLDHHVCSLPPSCCCCCCPPIPRPSYSPSNVHYRSSSCCCLLRAHTSFHSQARGRSEYEQSPPKIKKEHRFPHHPRHPR